MTQRSIEAIVSRLLSNEDLRERFLSNPHRAMLDLIEHDTDLTQTEIRSLTALDAIFWQQLAEYLEPACLSAA